MGEDAADLCALLDLDPKAVPAMQLPFLIYDPLVVYGNFYQVFGTGCAIPLIITIL